MDNMKGFGMMIQELKKNPKTIVFTEGTDERILEAASRPENPFPLTYRFAP